MSGMVFIAAKAECKSLAEALEAPLSGAFRQNPETTAAGKEALPLQMAVVAAFERRACWAEAPRWEIIVLDSYLIMIWGGLRWSCLQRTSPSSLVLDNHALRGVTWRSKAPRLSQPFGLWTFGLTTHPSERGWGACWLQCVAEWVRGLCCQAAPNVMVDYLLSAMHEGAALAEQVSDANR